MDLLSDDVTLSVADPLDAVEQAVIAEQFPYDRDEGGELHLSAPGNWRDHQIWFAWRPELDALHICSSLDLKVPANRFGEVCELVARLNEKLWMGHFDVWAEDGSIVYRHAIALPGGETVSPAQASAMLAAAREAGERFYPAFHFLVWGGKSAQEAAAAAMFETAGEA
ncbi:MAG: YbjN domain-containing protein [Pseudomonadota bacterium]|nr:YbjN domain-containing protein [Pseudomonadota bacterium]